MIRPIIFPAPLQQGDTIGVTAPSSGIGASLEPRLQFCLQTVRALGYQVCEGQCLRSDQLVSAGAPQRAAELTAMLLDDSIQAVIPPWGGELLIDLLERLDFARLAQAKAKWLLGYSDLTTLLLPYTMLTGIATAHGSNFMETPIHFGADPLARWSDLLTLPTGAMFTQGATTQCAGTQWIDWNLEPTAQKFLYSEPTQWQCLHHEQDTGYEINVSGRLLGGCLDVISMLPGTPYGDVSNFARTYAPEGLLFYLENCGDAAQACRMYHHLKLAGWFQHANALLIGRSSGPDKNEFTHRDALYSALGNLDIPVFYDLDIGHVPPQMLLVNGASATFTFAPEQKTLCQTLR
jgi:muramoyltetrapeptide carboxypeptidase LdcA involved in peptidoglycan recycling